MRRTPHCAIAAWPASLANMREEWDRSAETYEENQPKLGRVPIPGLIRKVRRTADLSQRELAGKAGLSQSTVARVESGTLVPSLDVLQRLLACADFELVAVDQDRRLVLPMRDAEWTRDGAERRYPSHLDTILNPPPGNWWSEIYGLHCPPETFIRDRAHRDEMRARHQWETRPRKFGNTSPPSVWVERERAARIREERARLARENREPWSFDDYDDD
jgi:transcriptional regulator with XRE-family HTH domain